MSMQSDDIDTAAADLLDYGTLKAFARQLGRPAAIMRALSSQSDPFAITPARLAGAKWFAGIWKRLGLRDGVHLRRIHYLMISQKKPVRMVNSKPYENTHADFQVLIRTSGDARFLDLVAAEHLVDRRNAEPLLLLSKESRPGFLSTIHERPEVMLTTSGMPDLPRLWLSPPQVLQPYHLEIWCEKTTINDIVEPIASQYGLNVITGAGELSQTLCVNLVERAEQSDRPVRILYISDFDRSGHNMPVSVARKIEHRLALKNIYDLDIQVRPIALTQEQCKQYELPRAPPKEDERRAPGFEDRFSAGVTELDALEALHPGELHRIIEREIERYYDADLDAAVRDKAAEVNADLSEIVTQTHAQFRGQIKPLQSEWDNIEREHARKVEAWCKRANPVWQAIAKSLTKQKPLQSEIDWPEPADGDEDLDPLFDSTRSYVEQIDRYKQHQGKPTTRKSSGKRGGTTDD